MGKVYVLVGSGAESSWVEGVYATEETAESACEGLNKDSIYDFEVEEWEVK